MKLNKKNTITGKNFAIPISLLNKPAKQNNEPRIKKPKPNAIRGSNNSGKTLEDENNRTPITAKTEDHTLNPVIKTPLFF
jgi:hypothetical protein